MPHPAAALVDDILTVRAAQDRELARLGRGPTLNEQREMADLGAQHRELFADLEMSLPQPAADADPLGYRVELLSRLKRFSPSWRDADLTRLARSALWGIEREVLADARRIAGDRTVGSFRRPGGLRELHRTDAAGHRSVEFAGSPLSWMSAFMTPVVTMVEAFVDPRTGRHIWR